MNGEDEAIQTIREAIERRDPQLFLQLAEDFSTWERMVRFREKVHGLVIHPSDYDLIFQWTGHQDVIIAKIASALVLFIHDIDMKVDVFERFLEIDIVKFPYQLSYNFSEKEFHIDLPGVPGMGVSHYGRDDIAIDQFLLLLEKIYAKLYPENVPAFFRR